MSKTILITGSTDGLGLATAKMLLEKGQRVILHGRNKERLHKAREKLLRETGKEIAGAYLYDLSHIGGIEDFVANIRQSLLSLDVLINNAGVFAMQNSITPEGLDARFAVNTIAPYVLTKALLPLMDNKSRVINLSSAAQAPVSMEAFMGKKRLTDNDAYAQSKLALTMWSYALSLAIGDTGPAVIAVNPKSFLGTAMVKTAYGVTGSDVTVGADILMRAALSDEFVAATGKYFDNDIGQFASPHSDAHNTQKVTNLIHVMDSIVEKCRGI